MQEKPSNKNGWILPTILGALFLLWLFSGNDHRTTEKRLTDQFEEKASKARLEEKIDMSRQDINEPVLADMKRELAKLKIPFSSVEISENHFVWVYISGDSRNGDELANSLCFRAKKHFMQGVTLFDSQGNTVGRSICK